MVTKQEDWIKRTLKRARVLALDGHRPAPKIYDLHMPFSAVAPVRAAKEL